MNVVSNWRWWIYSATDHLCRLSGHRWCHLCGRVFDWARKAEVDGNRE